MISGLFGIAFLLDRELVREGNQKLGLVIKLKLVFDQHSRMHTLVTSSLS